MKNNNMWMVRAGSDGYLFDEYHNKKVIAIGYGVKQNLTEYSNIDDIKIIAKQFYPQYSLIQISIMAGQLYRFKSVMNINDYIITYDPTHRNYLVGEIIGDYKYNENLIPDYPHTRQIKWLKLIPRDMLTTTTKNSLGVIMTMFEIPEEQKEEILYILDNDGKTIDDYVEVVEELDNSTELNQIKNDIIANATEFIKDKVLHLSHKDLKDLTAGILKAMGYQIKYFLPYQNRDYDLEASKDGFGFNDKITIVKIIPEDKPIRLEDISKLEPHIENENKGLITVFGRYTDEILKEAEKNNIKFIDLEQMVNLLTQHYEELDSQTKFIIPLTRIYWPL
jgi:restriction system protein